jgi:hypothetical protein
VPLMVWADGMGLANPITGQARAGLQALAPRTDLKVSF